MNLNKKKRICFGDDGMPARGEGRGKGGIARIGRCIIVHQKEFWSFDKKKRALAMYFIVQVAIYGSFMVAMANK